MLRITVPLPLAFAGFSFVALFSPVASAQSTISGQAKDSSGAVMSGVSVEAASPALIERSRAVITNHLPQKTPSPRCPGRGVAPAVFAAGGFRRKIESNED
jgi:hypothetical protein